MALDTILRYKRPALQRVHLENLKEIRNGDNRAGEARMFRAQCEPHGSVLQVSQAAESGARWRQTST